jgi:hypothetical protein
MFKFKLIFFCLFLFLYNCEINVNRFCDSRSKNFITGFLLLRAIGNNQAYCYFPASSNSSTSSSNTLPQITVTVSPAYTSASNWMDYIRRNMSSPSSIAQTTITLCDGSETGWYNSCIHGGELKKFELTNQTDCTGISTKDTLDAFNWVCVVQSGKVFIYSTGLKYEKNLSDLLDFTSASFLNNSVTVSKAGQTTPIATSNSAKWWSNPIVIQNTATNLSSSGTIYIVNATPPNGGYSSTATKVGFIVKPEITITNNGSAVWFSGTNSTFNWIEGSFFVTTDNIVIQNASNQGQFTQFRNLRVRKDAGTSSLISLSFGTNSRMYVHNSRLINFGNTATSSFNSISNRMLVNGLNVAGGDSGIRMNQTDMIFLNLAVSAQGGISNIEVNNFNFIHSATLANSSSTASSLVISNAPFDNNTFTNLITANSPNYGISYTSNSNLKFINTISAHNTTAQIFQAVANATNCMFNGVLKTNNTSCNIFGGTPGISATCAKVAPSELAPATVTSLTLSTTFVGKVSSDDTINTQDTNGVSTASSHLSDPFNFENSYRSWGRDGGSFPISTNRDNCIPGNCRIWDWSLRATDTVARNANPCPTGTITDIHTWSDSSTVTSLRNARELLFDGVGNDNGICESNEDCLYTPNIGAYQGHGNLSKADASSTTNSNTCSDIGSGGTIQNVKLFKYETNGY